MTNYLFFLSEEEFRDGSKTGFAYAKTKQSYWVQSNISSSDLKCAFIDGMTYGQDHVIYNDIVYEPYKKYVNIDENYVLTICKECMSGCETKNFD